VVFGVVSCALCFLEPQPFVEDKPDFLILLGLSTWIIYTADHILDGFKQKGISGIFRYDFNYRYRWALVGIGLIFSGLIAWLVYLNLEANFVFRGFWLTPILVLYFILKFKGVFSPIAKMLIISVVVSTVVVSFYPEQSIFVKLFGYEQLAIILIAFLNQLVLEHFESHEEHKANQPSISGMYETLSKKVFIWLIVLLGIITFLNIYAWPYTLAMFFTGFLIRYILAKPLWFSKDRRYRYFADFALVLIWPLLKSFLIIQELF
jgi:hypothetical protein